MVVLCFFIVKMIIFKLYFFKKFFFFYSITNGLNGLKIVKKKKKGQILCCCILKVKSDHIYGYCVHFIQKLSLENLEIFYHIYLLLLMRTFHPKIVFVMFFLINNQTTNNGLNPTVTDSCCWNYNYWCFCFSICLFSVLLSSSLLWLGAGGLHMSSALVCIMQVWLQGSLINGWSQRDRHRSSEGVAKQQHPANSTTIQHYMWVALTISTTFFIPVFYACTGTEVKPRALGWIKYYILYIIINALQLLCTGSQCGFLGCKQEVTESEQEEMFWARWSQLTLILTHTHNHKVTHTPPTRDQLQDITMLAVDINTPLAHLNAAGTLEKISDRCYF